MRKEVSSTSKVVVVHRGARDAYQVSRALREADLLETLVTDLYWPGDKGWAKALAGVLPKSLQRALGARYAEGLPSSAVRLCVPSGPLSFLLDKMPRIGFEKRRRAQRATDAALGRLAGQIADRRNATLLSYSYYGYHAFTRCCRPGILFQVHPHPASVRRILVQELENHPDCRSSLEKEWELALPPADFERLTAETEMASRFICASSFTRQTLIENGARADLIDVVPYGVDSNLFSPSANQKRTGGNTPLKLLFVGTINQRKGIKYLLEALRILNSKQVELTVCGRVVDDLRIFERFGSQVKVRADVSRPELIRAYQESDLFVFPSVAEGFAQVLLEALSCGVPILGTTHTAAPDLIDEGVHGFVVDPRRPDLIADRIEWSLCNRSRLRDMSFAARGRAEVFTWKRFREGIIHSVQSFEPSHAHAPEALVDYV